MPDLDAVLHTADFACVKREWAGTPLPLFGYQASAGHRDLAWPDFTFWGHEHQFLQVGSGGRAAGRAGSCVRAHTAAPRSAGGTGAGCRVAFDTPSPSRLFPPRHQDPWGGYVYGWPAQADLLRRKYGNVSLAGRVPQAMWRGRTHDALYPERDRLRWVGQEGGGTLRRRCSVQRRFDRGRGAAIPACLVRRRTLAPAAAGPLRQAPLCGVPPRAAARGAAAGCRSVLGVAAAGGAAGCLRLPVRAALSCRPPRVCCLLLLQLAS